MSTKKTLTRRCPSLYPVPIHTSQTLYTVHCTRFPGPASFHSVVFAFYLIPDSRLLWYPEEFMVDSMTARCPDPVAAEQAQIISPPPPCLTVGMRCLCWYAVFGFLQTCCCALWPNISTLVWSVQRTLFQNSCGLFRCNFTNLGCAAMFFLERRGFLLSCIIPASLCMHMKNACACACDIWGVILLFCTRWG